jgi:hypothetical protein
MGKRLSIYIIGCMVLLFGWANCAGDAFQDLSNNIQYQSANTLEGLQNYQRCYDISRDWWKLHEPELALDFLYEAAREAEILVPAKLSATKLLELADLATREYRDRYTAEDMIQKARSRLQLILEYYEWRIPFYEANRIEKEAEKLKYLPRGKYIPRQVILPTPGTGTIFTPDYIGNNLLETRESNQSIPNLDFNLNPSKPRPPDKPPKPPLPPDKPPKPPLPPDKPPKPPLPPDKPPKPPLPPDKPPKPPLPPDKPPKPPSSDTAK